MLFNSFHFLLFFPIVIILYFLIPPKWRWAFLLASSYYFYMAWKAEYALLIMASTLVDYYVGIKMSQIPEKIKRKKYLYISLASNLGLLFAFKYLNFFNETIRGILNLFNIFYGVENFDILLPVGISFYTFQTLSYTIDVYRGRIEPERHLGVFALYVSFWPQLVAGPIERSRHLLPQFSKEFEFDYERIRAGLLRILWGFVKKVVIADRLAAYVDEVYNNPGVYDGGVVLLATYFFAFQVYCDFSGYSDIAIGSARVMGYDLMENFRRPYFSRSVPDFWRRWHVSLSTWWRDYLYIPLGGNRVPKWRWYINLLITFMIGGLWHGASWKFVMWGALNGIYMVFGIITRKPRAQIESWLKIDKIPWFQALLQIVVTFHLILLTRFFFRANSFNDAILFLAKVIYTPWSLAEMPMPRGRIDFIVALLSIILLMIFEKILGDTPLEEKLLPKSTIIRWSFYVTAVLLISWFGIFTENQFIYFQF